MEVLQQLLSLAVLVTFAFENSLADSDIARVRPCASLLLGQYTCIPARNISTLTQQPEGCGPNNLAPARCNAAPGINCTGLLPDGTFFKEVPCSYTNGYSFQTALILSTVLGWTGADRFYMGYYGVGLIKLCTLGGFFLMHLVDIILVASGVLGPADGSHFIAPFYGPPHPIPRFDINSTYVVPNQL